jgi:hypothetical protein
MHAVAKAPPNPTEDRMPQLHEYVITTPTGRTATGRLGTSAADALELFATRHADEHGRELPAGTYYVRALDGHDAATITR